jgi:hypothetical protein
MSEINEWEAAVEYNKFLSTARENVELMKARFNDLSLSEGEEEILQSIQNEIKILVLGTDRCNDTAGILPVLARMASLSPTVQLRILDSDANAKFHQNYRVNGKRKTPVVLFLNSDQQEIIRWAERPNAAYKVVNEKTTSSMEARRDQLKTLYSDSEIQRQTLGELLDLLLRADLVLGRT